MQILISVVLIYFLMTYLIPKTEAKKNVILESEVVSGLAILVSLSDQMSDNISEPVGYLILIFTIFIPTMYLLLKGDENAKRYYEKLKDEVRKEGN